MDFSLTIAWFLPLLGVILAGLFGASGAKSGAESIWGVALFTSIVIGFVLMIAQVFLHSYCVEMKGCQDSGDGNMSYWFQSFFAIPIYWLVSVSVWQMKR
ncbi:MAG: hypothetical protein V4858_04720 [Pseudomonadota bacterium]